MISSAIYSLPFSPNIRSRCSVEDFYFVHFLVICRHVEILVHICSRCSVEDSFSPFLSNIQTCEDFSPRLCWPAFVLGRRLFKITFCPSINNNFSLEVSCLEDTAKRSPILRKTKQIAAPVTVPPKHF